MLNQVANGYFELTVEPYRLAVPTRCVLGVMDRVAPGADVIFRDRRCVLIDLRSVLAARTCVAAPPFGLILETRRGWLVVGVDAIGAVPITDVPAPTPLPTYGLLHPELFRGVLRWRSGLFLALDVEGLVRYVNAFA